MTTSKFTFPTADQVARMLIAACRETDFPVRRLPEVLSVTGPGRQKGCLPWHFGRARALAAIALHEMFPAIPVAAIGRMVGTRKKDYLNHVQKVIRAEKREGFDHEAVQRVIDVGSYVLPGRHPIKLEAIDGRYVSADRPVPPRRVIDARNMLAEAVRNTAALPIPE